MIKLNRLYKFLLIAAISLTAFTSCELDDLFPSADRLFRPIMKSSTISGTWVQLEWDRYQGAISYEIDMSVDTFKTFYRSLRTDSTRITLLNLEYDTKYQVRIRAVGDSILANGDTIRSAYNIYNVATIDYPTQMKTPAASDILDKSIRVKWNLSSLSYTRIDVAVSRDSVYKSIPVTADENLTGEKIITGLQPKTTYFVKLYQGDEYKGKKIFKTNDAQVFEGDVVDLRDLSDDKALNVITQTFVDSLGLIYPNGFNLILSGGTSYVLPTINIPVSMNIITGLSFKGNAIMRVNGSISAKAATTVPSLKLQKIFFDQGNIAGKFKTDANFGGTYVINMNQTDGHFTEVLVDNCIMKYKRGVVRLQTVTTIGKLTINNCVADSIGGYGIVNLDNAGCNVVDLVIKNSTFSQFDGYLCRNTKTTAAQNSVTIENVTTCFAPASGRYFVELTTANPLNGGIKIKNCVFGSVMTAGTTVHGIRSVVTAPEVDNCFKTSDLVWTVAVGATEPTYPIVCTDLGKTSAEIFENPAQRSFRVTNAALVRKAGDPRWW